MNSTEIITAESDRLAAALVGIDPATPVPTCPEWTAVDLLRHITEVHHFWATILSGDLRASDDVAALFEHRLALPEAIEELLPVRAAATRSLVAALEALADTEPRWTWWTPDQTVGFTRRMQVCEATMHRIDAELTAGLDPSPLAPELAAHCITHCVEVMWAQSSSAQHTPGATALITPTPGKYPEAHSRLTWLVNFGQARGRDGKTYPRAIPAPGDAEPEVVITASLEDLARWAWGRGGEVTMTGSEQACAAVRGVIEAGIQ